MPEVRFIRRIERPTSIEEVKKNLNKGGINIKDCFVEHAIPQEEFRGRYQYVRIVLPSQSRADELAISLRSSKTLHWKLSRKQPVSPPTNTKNTPPSESPNGNLTDSNLHEGSQSSKGSMRIPVPQELPSLPPVFPPNFLGLPPWLPAFLATMVPPIPPRPFAPLVLPHLLPPPPPSHFPRSHQGNNRA